MDSQGAYSACRLDLRISVISPELGENGMGNAVRARKRGAHTHRTPTSCPSARAGANGEVVLGNGPECQSRHTLSPLGHWNLPMGVVRGAYIWETYVLLHHGLLIGAQGEPLNSNTPVPLLPLLRIAF